MLRRTLRNGTLALGTLALTGLACCDEPLEPQTEGCLFDTTVVSSCTVAVLEVSGGLTGARDRYQIRDDGTVKYENLAAGSAQERAVPGGSARAQALDGALMAAGLLDVELGCWESDSETADGLTVRVTWRRGERLYFYGSECGSGPSELLAAIGLLQAYVDEAR